MLQTALCLQLYAISNRVCIAGNAAGCILTCPQIAAKASWAMSTYAVHCRSHHGVPLYRCHPAHHRSDQSTQPVAGCTSSAWNAAVLGMLRGCCIRGQGMTSTNGPTGEELLLLDTHKLYLPEREESINANLWDTGSEYFHRALDEWPDTVAPFVAVTEACADVMAPLRLPPADSSAGRENGSCSQDISLQALALSPDDSQPSGGAAAAEAQQNTCSPPRSAASKRKRDSLSDDGGDSAAPDGAPASADVVASSRHSPCIGGLKRSCHCWHAALCLGERRTGMTGDRSRGRCAMVAVAKVWLLSTVSLLVDAAEVDASSQAERHVPNGYPGTLFRLPLRSKDTAARSEVCKEPGSLERLQVCEMRRRQNVVQVHPVLASALALCPQHSTTKIGIFIVLRRTAAAPTPYMRQRVPQELMHEFAAAAHEMLLFTRNVRKVTVLVVEPGQQRAKLLGKVQDYH